MKDTTGTSTAIQAAEEFQWAKKCVQLAKDKMKVYHDRRVKDLHLYEEGTEVWYDLREIILRHPSRRGKLLPRFVGPLKILMLIGRSAVRLNMPASLSASFPKAFDRWYQTTYNTFQTDAKKFSLRVC